MLGLILTCLCELYTVQLFSQCAKCEQVRAYNAAHPENNYTYYDDYLKDHPGQKQAPEAQKAPATAPAPAPKTDAAKPQ